MISRRHFLAGAAAGLVGCAAPARTAPGSSGPRLSGCDASRTITGTLSGRTFCIPDVDAPPMPSIGPSGVVHDGIGIGTLGIDPARGHPDARSFRRKLGLLIPATNTTMEHELWTILVENRTTLDGMGLHTTNVVTPRPRLETAADLLEYKRQFVGGLHASIEQALLAKPQYLIMGMSLEHILRGIGEIRALMAQVEAQSDAAWATWHQAAPAALEKFGAKRIGLLTPFDRLGNENATRMFEDLGFEVSASVGFACADALHIAHVPDSAKERAIRELLAVPKNRLDAVVQCGTNMSLVQVSERLEPALGIPILGINAVTLWYALRENGFTAPLRGGGRLLREF
jgi:maleate isomerase